MALPRISPTARIQPDGNGHCTIVEIGEVRAYPSRVIRLSVIWKAEIRDRELKRERLDAKTSTYGVNTPIPVDGLFEDHISIRDLQRSMRFYRDVFVWKSGSCNHNHEKAWAEHCFG